MSIIKEQAPGKNHDTAEIFTVEPAGGVLPNRPITAKGSTDSGDGESGESVVPLVMMGHTAWYMQGRSI